MRTLVTWLLLSSLVLGSLACGDDESSRDPGTPAYTGWSQRTGRTFFSTRPRGQPVTIDVAHAAPGFAEALQVLREGEKAMVWVPSSPGTSDVLVCKIEVVDVVAPPAIADRSANEQRAAPGARSR